MCQLVRLKSPIWPRSAAHSYGHLVVTDADQQSGVAVLEPLG
jgi:hypothetical protein